MPVRPPLRPQPPPEDPQVQREIRRYRALRAIGWLDGCCNHCRSLIWNRAGEHDNLDAPVPESAAYVSGEGEI